MNKKEKYKILQEKYRCMNEKIKGTMIDSHANLMYRETRDEISKKIKKFEEEHPEVLI